MKYNAKTEYMYICKGLYHYNSCDNVTLLPTLSAGGLRLLQNLLQKEIIGLPKFNLRSFKVSLCV